MFSDEELDILARRIAENLSDHLIPKKLLTVSDVARLLGYSVAYFRRFYRQAKIPYVIIGGKIRFNVKDLYKWIEDRKIDPSQIQRNIRIRRSKRQRGK